MVHLCEGCGANGDTRSEVEHKDDCPDKFKITKICMKSGKAPHLPKD